ncbi:GGDEF domain-containing protein [Shewanella sp. NFH-SH190041]|uniref:sensor domain-containing diguanylate cyclase n=1 Tax=Shewanella sp. NFH-SH190041 TaxID=2950245 RepID=UPI0021C3773E|nr:GGDEF domain-containing protein [Shewanella sp. NFH-SH190041]BDM63064.1 GGDEF domain-containing protein [Shewanella sp. NFH-SH190041]
MNTLNLTQLQEIVSLLPDPAFILSQDGYYIAYLGGVDHDNYHDGRPLIGKSLYDVLPKSKANWFIAQIHLALKHHQVKIVEYDLDVQEVDGVDQQGPVGMLHFEGKIVPLNSLFHGQRAVLWLTRNITHRYQLEQQLRTLSETDALTGLYNRRRMLDTLRQLLHDSKKQRRLAALLILDIDLFKKINDKYGHQVGDTVLEQICEELKRQLRDGDIAARIGGEEFAILLPHSRLDEATLVAERIRCAIAKRQISAAGSQFHITVSIGLTQLSEDDNCSSALTRADAALYRAKAAGRNRVEQS